MAIDRSIERLPFFNIPFSAGGFVAPIRSNAVYVDTLRGKDNRDGTFNRPLATMSAALSKVQTGGTIYFTGDVREELVGSNLKFDVTIVGMGGIHHADQPDSSNPYDTGASVWRAPASPTAATPLLEVRGRGWKFVNILFDCPVDAAAVKLVANAESGTSEYDASHASFIGCQFTSGYRGIEDSGGCVNVTIRDCVFRIISVTGGCAVVNTSTSVRVPQFWRIQDNFFPGNGASGGNESHIDAPLSASLIKGNTFGIVEGTALYIDLTGGDDNIVTGNYLSGTYDTSDYVAGTNDGWVGNYSADTSQDEVGAEGFTIAVPAAP